MGDDPSLRELAGSTHHQQSCIFQVERRPKQESITAKKNVRQAKSTTKTRTSLPAPRAPIQQVRRSRNPPGKGGNGSWANPLGQSWCQTVPLPAQSGAKATCAESGGCRSKPLHSQRGTSPCVRHVPAAAPRPERCRRCGAGTATAIRADRPRSLPRASPAAVSGRNLFNRSPRPGLAKPNPPSANCACRIREHPRVTPVGEGGKAPRRHGAARNARRPDPSSDTHSRRGHVLALLPHAVRRDNAPSFPL